MSGLAAESMATLVRDHVERRVAHESLGLAEKKNKTSSSWDDQSLAVVAGNLGSRLD